MNSMNLNVKIVISSLFLMSVYLISAKFSILHMLFYPTLGAFCFLISSRKLTCKEALSILAGATAASAIGVGMYEIYDGPVTIFIAALLVMRMIMFFKLNAPPIIAISLIPFFSHPPNPWISPVFTLVSLSGLFLTLGISDRIVQYASAHPLFVTWWSKLKFSQESRSESA